MARPKRAEAVQDNELINAVYGMTLNEKRLLMLAVAQVNPNSMEGVGTREPMRVVVKVSDWMRHFGGESGTAYRDAYAAARRLSERSVLVGGEYLNWTDKRCPRPSQGEITIYFGYSISLLLRGDLPSWTPVLLDNAKGLTTFASWRLYELLAQFRNTGFRRMDVEDLRAALDPDKRYARFADWNRRVLKPALEDVNSHTDLRAGVELVKVKKVVTVVKFNIWRQPAQKRQQATA